MVSTTVVLGCLFAYSIGTNCPLSASLPRLIVVVFGIIDFFLLCVEFIFSPTLATKLEQLINQGVNLDVSNVEIMPKIIREKLTNYSEFKDMNQFEKIDNGKNRINIERNNSNSNAKEIKLNLSNEIKETNSNKNEQIIKVKNDIKINNSNNKDIIITNDNTKRKNNEIVNDNDSNKLKNTNKTDVHNINEQKNELNQKEEEDNISKDILIRKKIDDNKNGHNQ